MTMAEFLTKFVDADYDLKEEKTMTKFLIKFLLETCPIQEDTTPNPILIFKRVFLFVNSNENEETPLGISVPSTS